MTSEDKEDIVDFFRERTGPLTTAEVAKFVQENLGKKVSTRTLQRERLTSSFIPTRSLIVEHRPTRSVGAYRGANSSGASRTGIVELEGGEFITPPEAQLEVYYPLDHLSITRPTKSLGHGFSWRRRATLSWAEVFAGSNRMTTDFREQLQARRGAPALRLRRLECSEAAWRAASERGEPYGEDDFMCRFEDLTGEALEDLVSCLCSWWSPLCTTVGKQAASVHRRMPWNHFVGVSELSFTWNGNLQSMADALISRVTSGPKWNGKPHLFCIENPDVAAFLQHPAIAQIMEKVPDAAVAHIKYCRFGKKYQKATAIVTNSVHVKRRLDDIMANNRWPNRCKACHESERHKESVRHDNCRSAAWLPKPLCQVINEEIIAELNL